MYSFSGKNNLVWTSFILFNNRPELNQEYSLDIELPEKRKFDKLPSWVYDKHVSGGTKGYQFFFDNSLVVNENIYEDMWGEGGDKYAEECKKVYLDDEKSLKYRKECKDRGDDLDYNKINGLSQEKLFSIFAVA